MFTTMIIYDHGGDDVRVGFRTTLEESLITQLKQIASERKKNVNDILEILIDDYLWKTEQVEKNVSEINELPEEERMDFLVEKIMDQIDECIYSYRFDYRGIPRNLIRDAIFSVLSNFFLEEE